MVKLETYKFQGKECVVSISLLFPRSSRATGIRLKNKAHNCTALSALKFTLSE